MPNRYAIANWKMNLPPEGIGKYLGEMAAVKTNAQIVVAPPYPYLKDVIAQATSSIGVSAQNCADQNSGAFTGEVSPRMLRDCGATYVIVGHSERRHLFGETDAMIARKLALAIENGLTPVLCVGEDRKVRDAKKEFVFVADQIKAATTDTLDVANEIVIAYEPVWAIGTGLNATGSMVAEMVAEIRVALARFWPLRFAQQTSILYGGSVTPDNIDDLTAHGGVDGFLVGGASLDSVKFGTICSKC